MLGWILVGEKSTNIKEVATFIDGFTSLGIDMQKVLTDDVVVYTDKKIYIKEKEAMLPDFVVPAFFGNYNYHNHSVMKVLERLGVLCINGYEGLINARDKQKSLIMLMETALLPKTLLYTSKFSQSFLEEKIGFPLVAKINHGAKGDGVCLVESYSQLENVVSLLKEGYDDEILLQEYISQSKGQDLRVIICGGQVITSFTRTNPNDFKSNLNTGGTLAFFPLDEKTKNTALSIAKKLNLNLCSVDFLIGENQTFYFCEANAMPGLSYVKAAKDQNIGNPLEDIARNVKKQVEEKKGNSMVLS